MAKDILLDDDDDLLIQNGDLVIGLSEKQEVGLVLRTNQGDWRAAPLTGFGLMRWLRGPVNRPQFESALTQQLLLDGFTQVAVQLGLDGQLTIDAKRYE